MKKLLVLFFFVLYIIACTPQKNTESNIRYVVTSPAIAEIIYLIEGPDHIVGVTDECDYPVVLKKIPRVGNFGNIDMEKVLELNPSLVFTSGLEQEAFTVQLEKLNIPVVMSYSKSVSDIIKSIRQIGIQLGKPERANFVADSLLAEIKLLTGVAIDDKSKPRVYMEIYGQPIMSVSDESFVGELVNLSGGKNIFAKLPREYSRVKSEEVINADPEIIILTYPGVTGEQISQRKGWEIISAVKNNRIYTTQDVNPDLILRPSPRIVEGIKHLREVINE